MIPEQFRTEKIKEKAKVQFDKVDVDHNGTLDRAEFQQVCFRWLMSIANEILATEMEPIEWLKVNFEGK